MGINVSVSPAIRVFSQGESVVINFKFRFAITVCPRRTRVIPIRMRLFGTK